jgi:hypothetical protein
MQLVCLESRLHDPFLNLCDDNLLDFEWNKKHRQRRNCSCGSSEYSYVCNEYLESRILKNIFCIHVRQHASSFLVRVSTRSNAAVNSGL